ncbi:hypothetical protein Gogos_010492 [Gossypium gossypioides]|uniref:DUF4283 domain-containing protein n=1 Tax=Gossypium gossypioides TaxID=34282 RepID=A0A7J9BLI8_GOSGO|nr:hypothetical protein [Gossypium gossypioides]
MFLFRFFHQLDIDRVVKGAPWAFNNHLLVFHRLDFIGSFVEYDAKSNSNGYKNILRMKVKLGARSLLKRQKKIQISPSIHTYARKQRWVGTSRYERRQGRPPRRGVLGYVRQES